MARVLSTKKLKQNQRLLLLNAGISLVEYNAIKTVFIPFEAPSTIENAIFTSQNGVNSLLTNICSHTVENCFCVGEKTKALLKKNYQKVIKMTEYASELGDFIVKNNKKDYFYFFCGNIRTDEIPSKFKENNIAFKEIEVYKTALNPKKFNQEFDAILFFSPSGVKSFFVENKVEKSIAVCIGNTTASEAKKYTENIEIANSTTLESVIAKAVKTLKKMLKNDLFLKALRGETVDRPPVWMMRQAGRYLPEFQEIKAKYDFFTRCQTPELASEITVQPIHRYGMDAAILFSDILVIPQAMNIEVKMKPGVGPWLPNPIRSVKDVEQVIVPNIQETLGYVMEAIKMTKEKLNNEIPLIGFAGSPWTILCYCVQGQGSKNFDKAKEFCFTQPMAAHQLLQKITDTTILYLKEKVKAGVNAVQVFDSWGGMLSPTDYQEFSWKYIQQIINALKDETHVIAFGKGCWFALDIMAKSGASALGVDWTCSPKSARSLTGGKITLQGNFDPTRLFSAPSKIKKMVKQMIDEFGKDRYIVNLGHGILPNIPLKNAGAFIEAVKEYKAS